MIQIEIIDCPDREVIAPYQFFHNQIYLGKKGGTLQLPDYQLKGSHLMLEVIEKDLLVHPQKGVESYLIDGKRASTVRKIKIGQTITIGSTTLKIVAFAETEFRGKKSILDEKLNQLIEANSPKLPVIEKLAGMMK